MSDEKTVLANEKPDRDGDVEPVNVTEQAPDRRRLIRRLVSLAAMGCIASSLLGELSLPKANAQCGNPPTGSPYLVVGDSNNECGNTTWLASDGTLDGTLNLSNTGDGPALVLTSDSDYEAVNISNTGDGNGINLTTSDSLSTGIFISSSGTGIGATGGSSLGNCGVVGETGGAFGYGVKGIHSGGGTGVYGTTGSSSFYGVEGLNTGGGTGVYGETNGASAGAVTGHATSTTGQNAGVSGFTDSNGGYGVYGKANNASGGTGICGLAGASGTGVIGQALAPTCIPLVAQGISGQTANLQQWQTSSGSAWSILSVVDANGNFGIGTTTPARSLHLVGHNANFRMDRDIDSSVFILVRTASGNFNSIWKTFYVGVNAPGSGNGYFFVGDNGTNTAGTSTRRLLIDNSGNVGIGTIANTQTSFTNILTLPNTASTAGRGLANAWSTYSSIRWKMNIQPIQGALDLIQRLRGVRFNWKSGGKQDVGLVAEEVGEVVPEIVTYEKNGKDAQSLDYSRLVPVLVQGMKEQQTTIQEQETRIEQLTTRNTEHQSTIQQLREEVTLLKSRLDTFEQTIKLAAS